MSTMLEIEIDGAHNESLYFRPLQRKVRGRFDMLRVSEPQAKVAASQWPMPIPSQRIGITSEGVGYVTEPLHDAEFSAVRDKIEAQGMKLEEARQEFDNAHQATWLFWAREAVRSGLAKVTQGKLPKTIDGTPRMDFVCDRQPTTEDRLVLALEKQNELFEKLFSQLTQWGAK